ncbi:MAG: glycosyltransferase family protein [Bacteroidales bacterium]|nr:glycosyltransferase family protein [Bacteroidales bacterium]
MFSKKTILVCPLDWGIGHATRCVPIIKILTELNQRVIIAADGAPMALLEKAFPSLDFIKFPGFRPHYSKSNSQVFEVIKQIPGILKSIREDHFFLEKIVKQTKADAVISDNRFGAYSNEVESVFITHQLHIQTPKPLSAIKPLLDIVNKHSIKKYSSCWIPDFMDDDNLSGNLSRPVFKGIKTNYIGPLSRFSALNIEKNPEKTDLLIMLSGPEPQRSLLENILLYQLGYLQLKTTILRGLPDENTQPEATGNIEFLNHASDIKIASLIRNARFIVARAGYSTIMDLVALGKSATLIPTPGQTEQAYLAQYLSGKKRFNFMAQNDVNLSKIIEKEHVSVISEPFAMVNTELHLRQWIKNL